MAQAPRPIDAQTAARLMKQGALMVDIREQGEFAQARIPGSRNVALSGFERADLRPDPGQAIVFLCASGNRTSLNAASLAGKAGGATAYVLQGGLSAWAASGLPVEAGTQEEVAEGPAGAGWSLFRRR